MAYIDISPGVGHEVMITGYNFDDHTANIQYFDPETGTYKTAYESEFNNVLKITGIK